MGRRKERRLAAMHGAGRRVKLDLFAEPSGEAGGSSSNDGVERNIDHSHHAGDPVSPSSSGVPKNGGNVCLLGQKQENPLALLGQYSDEELDNEADEQPDNADELTSLAGLDVQTEHGDVNSNKKHINDNDVAELVDKQSDKLDTTESKEDYGVQEEETISSTAIQNNETDSSTQAPEASGSQILGDVTGGWKMVMDEQSNRYYYWNTITGETSWQTPSSLALASENISGHDVSLTVDEDKTKSLVHEHSSMQLNDAVVAYSNISSNNQTLNGGGTHLSYDATNYNPVVTDISYGEASILPNVSSFCQSHIFSEHLTSLGEAVHASSGEHKDMHMTNYIESTEAAVAHSVTLIYYAESLLQRLNTLKRSGNHLADHVLIMKEIEIRIADCKALSSYGSSLLPFWWHTEVQLKQLESAIGKEESSQLITSKSCNKQNGDEATVSSESLGTRSEAVGKKEGTVALVLNDNSPSRYTSRDGQPETSNMSESKEAVTEQISSGPTCQVSRDEKEPEVIEANQAVLPVDLVNKDETNAIEDVDMDVEMEVDEEIPADQTATADRSIGEGPILLEQQIKTSLLTTDSVPSPPEEEWIPPPPPETEEIPPPPTEEPPTSPVPPPFPETLPLSSYHEQYNTGYSVQTYEYYTPTVNEIGSNGYYAPVEGCHIPEQATPYYGPVAATAFPHLGADVCSVEPIVYYDHSSTGIPTGPAASSGESSVYYVEAGSVSYHNHSNASLLDQTGIATSTMESGSSSLLPAKIESNSSTVSSGPCIGTTQPTSFTSTVQSAESSLVNGSKADTPPTTGNKNPSKAVRGKKRTLAVASSLRSNKKVSSMVNKWKAAKEELHGDEDEDEEPENAYELLERKRLKEIEEWRKRQIESGEAQDNANFLPLGGDWRERVRRKRLGVKTNADRIPSPEAVEDEKKIPNLTELSKGLPSGWQAYWDASAKEVYYGNTVTSETSWTKPS